MKFALACLLLCGSLLAQTKIIPIQDPSDPTRARISGVVYDERALPAAGITVEASPPGPTQGVLPHTETDEQGRFALAGLLPGHTHVSAFNETTFYPNADFGPWDRQSVKELDLPTGGEVSNLVLILKPVARIDLKATDATTGKPIEYPSLIWEVVGAPDRVFGWGQLQYGWLAPTEPIRVCVYAHGYQAVYVGGSGSLDQALPITLKPRQVFRVAVSLRPSAAEPNCFQRPPH